MSEAAEITDATEVMTEVSTNRPALDPIMVASYVENTWAIWQVETDPEVQLGDFSGAWIISPEGIQGFAADADWIDNRDDQQVMLHTVIRYPVVPVDRDTRDALAAAFGVSGASGEGQGAEREAVNTVAAVAGASGEGQGAEREAVNTVAAVAGASGEGQGTERETANTTSGVLKSDQTSQPSKSEIVLVDWEVIESNAAEAIAQAKKEFSAEFTGKKQPAWGSIAPLENTLNDIELGSPIEGLPGGPQGNAAKAAGNALVYARGLRAWIRQWNAFDKLRVRRLGPALGKYAEVAGLPLH